MKKTKYRLEVVLDVRGKKKNEAAQFLAMRRQELFEAEQELLRRQKFLEDCRRQIFESKEKMMAEFEKGTSAGNLVAHRNYIEVLKEREEALILSVNEQKENIKRAERAVDEAIDKLAEASKELRVIEKHKDKWQQRRKKEFEKHEQKLSDEIGAILHQRSEKL